MKPIQMADLIGQYQKIKDEIQLEIGKVLDTASFINGPIVKEFQAHLEDYLSVKHVIPCANGTDALQVIMPPRHPQSRSPVCRDVTHATTGDAPECRPTSVTPRLPDRISSGPTRSCAAACIAASAMPPAPPISCWAMSATGRAGASI